MIGILIISNGSLAQSLLDAAENIIGKQDNIVALDIDENSDIEEQKSLVFNNISELNKGKGVIILTDMFGSLASNLASEFQKKDVEIIGGVNLPMLVKLASNRDEEEEFEKCVETTINDGKKFIDVASKIASKS